MRLHGPHARPGARVGSLQPLIVAAVAGAALAASVAACNSQANRTGADNPRPTEAVGGNAPSPQQVAPGSASPGLLSASPSVSLSPSPTGRPAAEPSPGG
jgi:hypothetical protein